MMHTLAPAAPAVTSKEKASLRWLLATLGLIFLAIVLHIVIAWRMDIFGIFRDPHGRELSTSDHERKAKFLLNQAYVPDNFDALLIGASSQVNWRPEYLEGYRFYNESLEGGDASEERRLVEQALPHGHFKLALVELYPRITQMHLLQDGFDQVSRVEAFGSISALGMEYDRLIKRISHRPSPFFPNGSHALPVHAPPRPYAYGAHMDITLDPVAVADYRAMIQELRAHGTRIIYVITPVYGPYFDYNSEVFARYTQMMTSTLPPAATIDFLTPEYSDFRNDATNFIDNVHLSEKGADRISRLLNLKLQEVLKSN